MKKIPNTKENLRILKKSKKLKNKKRFLPILEKKKSIKKNSKPMHYLIY